MRFPAGRKRPQARYLRRSRFNGARGTIQLIGFVSLRDSPCHSFFITFTSTFCTFSKKSFFCPRIKAEKKAGGRL